MSPQTAFLLETASRIGISIFAGTMVSCLILHTVELLHFELMGSGLVLMGLGYPLHRD